MRRRSEGVVRERSFGMTKRKLIALVVCVLVVCAYVLRWYYWSMGFVMTRSECGHTKYNPTINPTIIVRQMPSSAPFWAVPFSFLSEDNPRHRCELYTYGSKVLVSAQTYSGKSYVAQTARVAWEPSGAATVFLDEEPVFALDEYGFWTKVKSDRGSN